MYMYIIHICIVHCECVVVVIMYMPLIAALSIGARFVDDVVKWVIDRHTGLQNQTKQYQHETAAIA